MNSLQQQHVLILGLGHSGLAMARWCARCGAHVTVADSRSTPPNLATLQTELPQVRFVAGAFTPALLHLDMRAVFISPGLAPQDTAAVLQPARAQGLWVGGELDLFAAALHALHDSQSYAPKVLAITGTNGKTTTTALTAHLLERAGIRAVVAGNIGPTLLDTLSAHMQCLPQAWVLELSSFQLDACTRFAPTAATVLNVTQDHLDWHGSMDAYAAAKARVFGAHGTAILNRDDARVMDMLAHLAPHSQPDFKPEKPARPTKQAASPDAQPPQRRWLTFGTDLPTRAGDYGLEQVNGMVWLVRATGQDAPAVVPRARRRSAQATQVADDVSIQRLMPADALRIRGRHNAANALAALALATQAAGALAPMLYGLREYRGEPHRVEAVGMLAGVEYVDDSKGTNVGATLAAINGLGADRRLVVILGGLGKGQDFSPLLPAVRAHVRAVVLIGQDAAQIACALEGCGVPLCHATDMPDAVAQAAAHAQAGDVVLLSPACASMDMFRDYAHRAEAFRQAVQQQALAQGATLEMAP